MSSPQNSSLPHHQSTYKNQQEPSTHPSPVTSRGREGLGLADAHLIVIIVDIRDGTSLDLFALVVARPWARVVDGVGAEVGLEPRLVLAQLVRQGVQACWVDCSVVEAVVRGEVVLEPPLCCHLAAVCAGAAIGGAEIQVVLGVIEYLESEIEFLVCFHVLKGK